MPDLHSLSINTTDWNESGRDDTTIQWQNASGDLLSQHFFPIPPNIEVSLSDLKGLRDFYRQMLIGAGMGLIQCDVIQIEGVPSVELIAKSPMSPSGMLYLASLTIPFRDCSYVIKHQAPETGMTGMRESVVFSLLPEVKIDEQTGEVIGWAADPYDPSLSYEVMRNRAEDVEWDERFPEHPLSRVRRTLSELKQTTTLSSSLKELPRFTL